MTQKMSFSPATQNKAQTSGEPLSKREQMKLDKAMKIFQSQENELRSHKRRAQMFLDGQGAPRKQHKTDPNYRPPSSPEITPPATPPVETLEQQVLANHLNPNYDIPSGSDLFSYILCYSYGEGEKQLQKSEQDWSSLDKIGEECFIVKKNSSICSQLNESWKQSSDRIHQPFGRGHRQLSQKYLSCFGKK